MDSVSLYPQICSIFVADIKEMEKIRSYLRILLPALFIGYLSCLVAFTHVHIVNGVTIVHSHPYQTNDEGIPNHVHGYAEFQLLHQLSVLQVLGSSLIVALLAVFYSYFHKLTIVPVYPDYIIPFRGKRTLRAPPIF